MFGVEEKGGEVAAKFRKDANRGSRKQSHSFVRWHNSRNALPPVFLPSTTYRGGSIMRTIQGRTERDVDADSLSTYHSKALQWATKDK